MGSAIAVSVFGGFMIGESQANAYFKTFVLVLVLEILLYAAAYNKKTILRGLLLFIAGIVVFLVFGFVRAGISVFADDESNLFLYYILLFLCAVGVFLVSRRRAGAFILYAVGAVLIGFIEYLYSSDRILCLVVFLIAGLAMIIYRNYSGNVWQAKTKRFSMGSLIIVSLIVCFLAAAVGTAAFYGVVAQLDPPYKAIKIFTKHMTLEEIEKAGITDYDTELVPTQAAASTKNEEVEDDPDQEADSNQEEESETENQEQDEKTQSETLFDQNEESRDLQLIRYRHIKLLQILLPIIIAVLIFLVFFLRWYLRRRWYQALKKKDSGEQVVVLYHFFLRDFGRMKIKKNVQETPLEYVVRADPQLKFFNTEKVNFEELTQIYVETGYGHKTPDAAQVGKFHAFYEAFYAKCRSYVGGARYFFKMFRL